MILAFQRKDRRALGLDLLIELLNQALHNVAELLISCELEAAAVIESVGWPSSAAQQNAEQPTPQAPAHITPPA
jgi:hypothetical protein